MTNPAKSRPPNSRPPNSRPAEAIAAFETQDDFQDAVDDLLTHGFDQADISLLADEAVVRHKLHRGYGHTRQLEDNPAVPRTGYVSTETIGDAEGALIGAPLYVGAVAGAAIGAATGGTMAAAIIGAAAAGGAGALMGAMLAKRLDRRHARYIKRQIDSGGMLLWVRLRSAADESRAIDILNRHAGKDVHIRRAPAH